MEGIVEKKLEIRNEISKILGALSESERSQKTKRIEDRFFEFANFLEANISLLYIIIYDVTNLYVNRYNQLKFLLMKGQYWNGVLHLGRCAWIFMAMPLFGGKHHVSQEQQKSVRKYLSGLVALEVCHVSINEINLLAY